MKKIFITAIFAVFFIYISIFEAFGQTSILRLDKDLFEYINNPSTEKEQQLSNKYPVLLPALAQTISNTSDQSNLLKNLKDYFSHPMLMQIYRDAINQYKDLSLYEEELGKMAQNVNTEFGTTKQPVFSVHVSGFKENSIYVSNTISLSIDKYLGSEYPAYKGFFSPSQKQQMKSQFIIRDFTKAWLMADFIKTEVNSGNLLYEMIEQGKLLYTLKKLLPDYSEQDIIGFSDGENEWCVNNHKSIWDTIIKKNALYSTDIQIINSFFSLSTDTKPMIKNAPKNTGSWIGYQIVKKYMEENNTSLKSLLSTDEKTILKQSKYKP